MRRNKRLRKTMYSTAVLIGDKGSPVRDARAALADFLTLGVCKVEAESSEPESCVSGDCAVCSKLSLSAYDISFQSSSWSLVDPWKCDMLSREGCLRKRTSLSSLLNSESRCYYSKSQPVISVSACSSQTSTIEAPRRICVSLVFRPLLPQPSPLWPASSANCSA